MAASLNFTTVAHVLDSWEVLRRMPNFDARVGDLIFEKFFAFEPESKVIFGFREDTDITKIRKENHGGFGRHARYFVQMIDKALAILGPDISLLDDILVELGLKHIRYGVKPHYFPKMGIALLATIEEVLQDEFKPHHKQAWIDVYDALSSTMIEAQIKYGNDHDCDREL